MSFRFSRQALLLAFLLLSSVSSYAGTRDGGGGVGVNCSGQALQMLDLHEALRSGLAISNKPLSREKAIAVTSTLLTDHLWMKDLFNRDQFLYGVRSIVTPMMDGLPFTDFYTGALNQIEFVKSLPLSQDLGATDIAAGCALEQVAYFRDDISTLQIVKSRWDELDWLNRSTLIAHELIYLFDRRQALENFGLSRSGLTSEGARDFVGKLFSVNGVRSKFDLLQDGASYLRCTTVEAPESELLVVDGGAHEVNVLITSLYGMSSVFETVAKVQGTSVMELWHYDLANAFDSRSPIHFIDEAKPPLFQFHLKKDVGQTARLQSYLLCGTEIIPLGTTQEVRCELRTNH